MSDNTGVFGSENELKMSSLFSVVKKNKAIPSLNQQLEEALHDAKAHIEELKRQYGKPDANAMHPDQAKQSGANPGADEKLFESMQLLVVIDTLKQEVIRLQNANQKLKADEALAASMVQETLKQAVRRRKQRAAMFGESDKMHGLGELEGAFDTDKRRSILYYTRILLDEFKKTTLEGEFRQNQLREFQATLAKVQTDALNINDRLGEFRQRKQAALSNLAQRVGMSDISAGPAPQQEDALMSKVHELQVNEAHEMRAMERELNEFEHQADNEQLFDGGEAKLPSAGLVLSSDDDDDGSLSDSSLSSGDDDDDDDDDDGGLGAAFKQVKFNASGASKKKKAGASSSSSTGTAEYDVVNPRDPASVQAQIVKRKVKTDTAFEMKIDNLQKQVADLQEQLRHTSQKNRDLESALYGGERNPGAFLLSPQVTPMVLQEKDGDAYLKSQRRTGRSFTFDRIFGPNVDQNRVFADVKGMISSVLDGYNVCLMGYGQTGAGKTHTMQGPEDNPGVNARAVKLLFKGIKALTPTFRFQVHVSMIEIYNERLTDLLDDGPAHQARFAEKSAADFANLPKLEIRRNARGMYVTNTTHVQVESAEDVMVVVGMGERNRMTFATSANEHSSRSHSVLTVTVDGIDQVTLNRTYGKLYLVDLAGSERVKHTESTGQRLVEAQYINKSLSALGDVMKALAEATTAKNKAANTGGDDGKQQQQQSTHIPYRNSKLTYLLQDALGGNSKTMMFVNVSPSDMHVAETSSSLDFAKRVRKVQLDPHATTQNAALQKYKIKLADMKEQAKFTTEKLKGSLKKVQKAVKERDEVIKALSEKLKQSRRAQHDLKRKQAMGGGGGGKDFKPEDFDLSSQPQDSWTTDDNDKQQDDKEDHFQ